MKCQGWISRCQNEECKFHYQRTDGLEICPDCGTPRERCKNEAVDGYNFCRYHGGPNPKNDFYGLQSQLTTNGKQSTMKLTQLASKYIEMQKDGRLLSNRASIEVIRDRIRQLAERIDLNQAPDRLANLKQLWEDYKFHRGQVDEGIYRDLVDQEFEKAYHDYASWKQMFEAVDLDRKLVESEVKIIKDIKAVLTAEDAYELSAQLLAAIIQTVNGMKDIPDKTKLYFMRRIQYEFTRIVGSGTEERVEGGVAEDSDAEGSTVD